MSTIQVLGFEAEGFVCALAALVVYRLLTSQINTKGLLLDKAGSGAVRPERVQLLISTITVAGKFLVDAFNSKSTALPSIDSDWLYLMGGSSGIYVARKLYERIGASKR
jgi:hypothetical protein